jgi:ectoine hydroxylase-related dioxygenase (phytanoyl-CoA dioxygenase family)
MRSTSKSANQAVQPPWRRRRFAVVGLALFVCAFYVYQATSFFWVRSDVLATSEPQAAPAEAERSLTDESFACPEADTFRKRRVEDSPPADTSNSWHESFRTKGVSAPFKVFETTAEANALATSILKEGTLYKNLVDPNIRYRSYNHIYSPSIMQLAHAPPLLARIKTLLGDDFMLFEVDIPLRQPGQVHRYHSDSSFIGCPPEDAVAVWVALRSVSCYSTLEVLPYSHRLEEIAQDFLAPHQQSKQITHEDYNDHLAAAKMASDLVTAKFGTPGKPPIKFIRMDVTDGEGMIFHPRAWHGSANTVNTEALGQPSRMSIAMRYMRTSCQARSKTFTPPFVYHPYLPPVALVHGTIAPADRELNNVYTWGGSTVVPAQKTPFHLLETRYTPIVSKAKIMSINVDNTKKAAATVTQDQAQVFAHPEVNWKAKKMTMYKTEPVTISTDRLASLEMHWTFQPQYGAPESAMGRHASEDLTVLLAGELRFTHLIHDGTFVRETLVSQPGSLSMIDTMVWHKTTAMSAGGALYLAINYLTRADLDGPITEHAKDLSKLYNRSISELTGPGIVFPYPAKGAVVASGRSVHVTKQIVPQGQADFQMDFDKQGFDVLVLVLSGSITLAGEESDSSSPRVLNEYDVVLIPADATATVVKNRDAAAEFELFEFRGEAYGDDAGAHSKLARNLR